MAKKQQHMTDALDPGALSDEERLVKAKADKIELEIAIKKKELISSDIIEKEWQTMSFRMKARLLQIPNSLAAELASETNPAIVEDLLKKRINEALLELSQATPKAKGG